MKDLSGKRFGSLTVETFSHVDGNRHAIWVCQCDCGKKTVASSTKLDQGKKISCGHLRRDALRKMKARKKRRREDSGLDLDDALTELGAWR